MAEHVSPRDRVLAAAFTEFAARGVAGARIDRIAAEAQTSKERVYTYFRSKHDLYTAVVDAQVPFIVGSVTLDVTDVPRYVGDLFDFFAGHPQHLRFIRWGRLETDGPPTPGADDALVAKIRTIADAQSEGLLPADLSALDTLVLITELASNWLGATEFHGLASPQDPDAVAARRAAAVTAAARLFPPGGPPHTRPEDPE
jgi:AcrR family transcriptional regulator